MPLTWKPARYACPNCGKALQEAVEVPGMLNCGTCPFQGELRIVQLPNDNVTEAKCDNIMK